MIRIISALILISGFLSASIPVHAKEAITQKPTIKTEFSKDYGCPPFKDGTQCKKIVEEDFAKCIARIDQEDEDTLLDSAKTPEELTQVYCEKNRDKYMDICTKTCK